MKRSIYRTQDGRASLAGFMDQVLAQTPYPYHVRFVDTRFGETHVVTIGDPNNPPLVMLHGSASNLLAFLGDAPKYMGDYFVVLIDIPGEAGKSAPIRPSWHNEEYIGWLDDVLNILQLSKATLLGVSFGGWIAVQYAAHRDCVEKLVLTVPAGIVRARVSAVFRSMLYSMQKEKGAQKMKRMIFGTDEIPAPVGYFFDMIQAHFVPRIGSPPLLSDEELKGIHAPVMILSGENDVFFPAHKAERRVRRLLPDAAMHIIPQGQHGMMETDERISRFLHG